jgi:hypothetical protein
MQRIGMILGTFGFGLGALAGFVLIGIELVEQDLKTAVVVVLGTAILSYGCYVCCRGWQRENQIREKSGGTS